MGGKGVSGFLCLQVTQGIVWKGGFSVYDGRSSGFRPSWQRPEAHSTIGGQGQRTVCIGLSSPQVHGAEKASGARRRQSVRAVRVCRRRPSTGGRRGLFLSPHGTPGRGSWSGSVQQSGASAGLSAAGSRGPTLADTRSAWPLRSGLAGGVWGHKSASQPEENYSSRGAAGLVPGQVAGWPFLTGRGGFSSGRPVSSVGRAWDS